MDIRPLMDTRSNRHAHAHTDTHTKIKVSETHVVIQHICGKKEQGAGI